jgi:hypothetical protein
MADEVEMKIHRVVSGPYDEDEVIWNLCLVEIDGELEQVELFFDDFDSAYTMVKYFLTSINPIVLKLGDQQPDQGYS